MARKYRWRREPGKVLPRRRKESRAEVASEAIEAGAELLAAGVFRGVGALLRGIGHLLD